MREVFISQLEKRIIIILMLINCFALLVNIFGISPELKFGSGYGNVDQVFIFTDSGEQDILNVRAGTYFIDGTSRMYSERHPNYFWPFTTFYEDPSGPIIHNLYDTRFRGVFADFDHTEFFVYTIIIFGFVVLRRLW